MWARTGTLDNLSRARQGGKTGAGAWMCRMASQWSAALQPGDLQRVLQLAASIGWQVQPQESRRHATWERVIARRHWQYLAGRDKSQSGTAREPEGVAVLAALLIAGPKWTVPVVASTGCIPRSQMCCGKGSCWCWRRWTDAGQRRDWARKT
ncbi:uncharacterized protein B0I36DRAFT_76663 [Microdochium trichocladiopsis]|uniref:Uncharacterized protein n=1 Tax=Microdochium trichocladiopsis TaxID=1682393 RepID=A0A9P9BV15_9PEZI|nr:uncharacterized protein B0I36DRAFT_76663 [Microdochium trichocladiopsis]KAH7038186.1 hypothetical protein B0I36DRAFT_76663 [Microdochium trichocladiopsis]